MSEDTKTTTGSQLENGGPKVKSNEFNRFNKWKGLIYSGTMRDLAEKLKDPLNPRKPLPAPINWHVYASNSCPHRCNFCIMDETMNEGMAPQNQIFGEKQKGGRLPEDLLYKVVTDAERMGVKLIHWSGGGEPFTNKDLPEVLSYQVENTDVKAAVSTNGLYLDKMLDEEIRINHLRVSVNAGTKETYELIGQTGWEKVINNLEQAVSTDAADHIGMGLVLTHQNYREIPEYIQLAKQIGVEFVHIRPAFWPKYNDEIKDAVQKIDRARARSDKVDVFIVTNKFDGFWNSNSSPCRATPMHAVLASTGEFLLCQDRFDLRFGDYFTQSFEEIWNSDEHYSAIVRAQGCNIRCVETNLNNQIEHIFVDDRIARELI